MKVRVSQNKINSVLSVLISTEDWSRHELDAIVRFGEPEIQIGGVFRKRCPECDGRFPPRPRGDCRKMEKLIDAVADIDADDVDSGFGVQSTLVGLGDAVRTVDYSDIPDDPECTFELPEASKRVRSDMPIMVEFGDDMFDDPEVCAKSWSDVIVRRIACAVERLRTTNANLVREEVYEF